MILHDVLQIRKITKKDLFSKKILKMFFSLLQSFQNLIAREEVRITMSWVENSREIIEIKLGGCLFQTREYQCLLLKDNF